MWELADAEKELKLLMSVASASEKELDSERYFPLLVIRSSLDPEQIFKQKYSHQGSTYTPKREV